MRNSASRRRLFPVNVWPAFADAITLVLAAVILLMLVALLAQQRTLARLRQADEEMARLREEKARIERRMKALAPAGMVDVQGDKVILQGEVLFDSGAADVKNQAHEPMTKMGAALAALLSAEPGQMVMVGGHTDDQPIHGGRFASNWELSAARALSVMRIIVAAGVPQERIVAAGFGEFHPRASNESEDNRRRNRRIEVLLVPMQSVSSSAPQSPTPR